MMSRLAQAKAWTGGKDPTFSAARMVCSLPAAPMIGAALGWRPLADSGQVVFEDLYHILI